MRTFLATIATFLALALSGCGLVYKMEINQGNYVTQDMVGKLKEGQTRQQVRLALGTPTTESVFHKDRWDYSYSLERRGRAITAHKLTLLFDGDTLKSWTVADLPTSPVVDRDPAYANLEKGATKDNSPGWWSKMTDWWRK
jgi:outer membrane protein assembly factor BamE